MIDSKAIEDARELVRANDAWDPDDSEKALALCVAYRECPPVPLARALLSADEELRRLREATIEECAKAAREAALHYDSGDDYSAGLDHGAVYQLIKCVEAIRALSAEGNAASGNVRRMSEAKHAKTQEGE